MTVRDLGKAVVFACAGALALATPAPAGAAKERGLRVAVDVRVELLSILCRLAGYPEYSRARTPYAAAVDRHFAHFSGHAAVRSMKGLHARWAISHNAPVALALYLDGNFTPVHSFTPMPPGLDARWEGAPVEAFLAEVREFFAVSGAADFFTAQGKYRVAVEARFRDVLADKPVLGWFDGVFGANPGATYVVMPGLLTGPHSYGAYAVHDDGSKEVAQVMSLDNVDAEGLPRPNNQTVETLVHEIAHSYVNAVFDPRAEEIRAAAEPLFVRFAAPMRAQAYGSYRVMVNESVVRAVTVLFIRERGSAARAERAIAEQAQLSFPWTGDLAAALGEVRRRRHGKLSDADLFQATRAALVAWQKRHP
jgi:Domain of unknown function (DUF4932)